MADNALQKLGTGGIGQSTITRQELLRRGATTQSFESLLREQLDKNQPLKISKHAQERIDQRGIELSTALLTQLRGAVEKARDKGARDLVVIGSNSAFIVNVPNNTIVTTMSGTELKDNIFTNIDSAVLI